MSDLEIFELCEKLAKLLGDKEAIADLKILYERHPEMFKDMREVSSVISEVVKEPDLIIKNPIPIDEKDYIAGKKLDSKKMGEVGIRKDGDVNKIFHANQKRLKNLDLMAKKEVIADGRDAHTPYTQAQSLDGRLVENNISSANKTQILVEASSAKAAPTRLSHYADKSNDLSRCNKALSISAKKIIANNTKENNIKQKIGEFFKQNKDKSNKDIDR